MTTRIVAMFIAGALAYTGGWLLSLVLPFVLACVLAFAIGAILGVVAMQLTAPRRE